MIKAFTIGGFRNFPNPPVWIGPLVRINIFVGANNSGKSNVLRYIQRVLVPSFGRQTKTKPLDGIDKHGGDSGPPWIQMEVPFDPKGSQDGLRRPIPERQLIAGLKGFLSDSADALVASVSFPRSDQRPFPIGQMPAGPEPSGREVHDLWNAITGSSGGGYAAHWYPDVANWVASRALADRTCHYIQAFRSLSTRLPEFESEYTKASGAHLIDALATIERPSWHDQDRKEEFRKLETFLQTLLEDSGARVEISSDRTHIIVHMGGRSIPLEALGSGIHEVFMLAADIVIRNDDLVLLEEPETHLHPSLQRKLMMFLTSKTESQIFITTHSSVIIDTCGANIFGVTSHEGAARVTPLMTNQDRFSVCRNLGYKASDLLQSNCVIWVEGPSDRIYIASWLKEHDPSLIEGVHYSIMFYGGRLLSHLTADELGESDLIQLLPINRHCVVVIDSDRGAQNQAIRPSKQRVINEVDQVHGISWLTEGREIENYYSAQDRDVAIRAIHRNVNKTNVGGNRYSRPLSYWKTGEVEERVANKISVAEWLVAHKQPAWDSLGLTESVIRLAGFIKRSNA
jgi:predicted ATPase